MKRILSILLIVLSNTVFAGDWMTPGGMSDKLALTVSYQPADSQFIITLKNQSADTLSLSVEARRFHGHIVVSTSGGQAVKYWDSTFRLMLLTGTWSVPVQSLLSQAEITWRLSVSQLRNLPDGKLDPLTLRGATIHAELGEVAVVPSKESFIANNAKQISKPITVPANPK